MLRAALPLIRAAAPNARLASRSARQIAQRVAQGRQWRGPGVGPSSMPGPQGRLTRPMQDARLRRSLLGIRIESGRLTLPPPPSVPVPGAHPIETALVGTAVGGLLALVAPTVMDVLEGLTGTLVGDRGRWKGRNSRPRLAPAHDDGWGPLPEGTRSASDLTVWAVSVTGTSYRSDLDCSTYEWSASYAFTLPPGQVGFISKINGDRIDSPVGNTGACGQSAIVGGLGIASGPSYGNRSIFQRFIGSGNIIPSSVNIVWETRPLWSGEVGLPWPDPPPPELPGWEPEPFLLPEAEPAVLLRPAVAPAVAPVVSPAGVPAPFTAPGSFPAPAPGTAPAPARVPAQPGPATAPRPRLAPIPRPAISPGPAGMPQPAPAPAPAPTPAGQVTVGSPTRPVTVNPSPPPPTLPGIAAELGRIERKLEIMLGDPRGGVPDLGFDPQPLLDQLADLLQTAPEILQGTTYELDSPCNKDEDGNKLNPFTVPIPDAAGLAPALLLRLDAIAALLREGHTMPAPTCKHARPAGVPVTVNFSQL